MLSSKNESKVEERFQARIELLTERLDTLATTVATTASAIAKKDGEIASLRRELAQKGVDRQLVDQVLAERQESASGAQSELVAARRLLERRRRTLEAETDPYKRRQKGYALLARNGFDPDVCRQATTEFLGQAP